MKLLVFSDSHSKYLNIKKAVALHPDADKIVHLGDGVDDLLKAIPELDLTKTECVSGNCDIIPLCTIKPPRIAVFEAENVRILICHGHEKNVKYSMQNLIYSAVEQNADIVLYGHTHQRHEEYLPPSLLPGERDKGLYIFNPGSISLPRDGKSPSYGIIEIRKGGILLSCGSITR